MQKSWCRGDNDLTFLKKLVHTILNIAIYQSHEIVENMNDQVTRFQSTERKYDIKNKILIEINL